MGWSVLISSFCGQLASSVCVCGDITVTIAVPKFVQCYNIHDRSFAICHLLLYLVAGQG